MMVTDKLAEGLVCSTCSTAISHMGGFGLFLVWCFLLLGGWGCCFIVVFCLLVLQIYIYTTMLTVEIVFHITDSMGVLEWSCAVLQILVEG